MKITGKITLLLSLLVFLCWTTETNAQEKQDTKKDEKKVVVIKKKMDKDGKVVVEKTVKEGDEADAFKNEVLKEIEVEVDAEEGDEKHIIIKMKTDGEEDVFEWSGDGELPEDIKKQLEEKGINIMMLDAPQGMHDTDPDKGFLGVILKQTKEITIENGEEVVKETPSAQGLKIDDVAENSAAESAGLKSGDILTRINDQSIENYDSLKKALDGLKAGTEISIEYLRDGNLMKTKATLKERPSKYGMHKMHKDKHFFKHMAEPKYELEEKPFMGVILEEKEEVTTENGEVKEHTPSTGIHIQEVVENSAAEAAGLKNGDIITSLDGETLSSVEALTDKIGKYQVGDAVKVGYTREGKKAETALTLKGRKVKKWAPRKKHHRGWGNSWHNPCELFIGVYLDNEKSEEASGITVESIIPNTPAEKSDLKAGDVITEIHGVAVNSIKELEDARDTHKPGETIDVTYLRDGNPSKTQISFKECDPNQSMEIIKLIEGDEIKEIETNENGEKMRKIIIIKSDDSPKDEVEIEEVIEQKIVLPENTLNLSDLEVFPNPTTGILNIKFSAEKAPITLSIRDLSGKEIHREEIKDFNGVYNNIIDISKGGEGAYFLSISQETKTFTEKVILTNAR